MVQLTNRQAQSIVDRMMKDIPYNINIMDQSGSIIGSGNPNRIGTLHYGAVEAIKQGEIAEIYQDGEYVKKGINLPIKLNGEIVGVVGISGEVEETRPFGNLLKSAVILLIEQGIALEKETARKNLKHEFISGMEQPWTVYTPELADRAMTYGIELGKPSRVLYVQISRETSMDEIPDHMPWFRLSNRSLFIIEQDEARKEALLGQIKSQYADAFISVSKPEDSIAKGIVQAKAAMRTLKGIFSGQKVIFYSDYEFIADMSLLHRNDPKALSIVQVLEMNEDLLKTLQVYIQCNLNAIETADRLIIHRNTLNYRLGRIHKLTGKDPKKILELTELMFMLVHRVHNE